MKWKLWISRCRNSNYLNLPWLIFFFFFFFALLVCSKAQSVDSYLISKVLWLVITLLSWWIERMGYHSLFLNTCCYGMGHPEKWCGIMNEGQWRSPDTHEAATPWRVLVVDFCVFAPTWNLLMCPISHTVAPSVIPGSALVGSGGGGGGRGVWVGTLVHFQVAQWTVKKPEPHTR